MKNWLLVAGMLMVIFSCRQNDSKVPVIGFVDAFQDNTIEKAKDGFMDALQAEGFDEKKGTVRIIYRNAQGNIPTLTQIVKYYLAQPVTMLATNPSLATITAVQNTKDIPIFMMVSPTPQLMKVTDSSEKAPMNLFGAAENLDYIDTSFLLIPRLISPRSKQIRVGVIFNQSEPQSVLSMERMRKLADASKIELVSLPVNSSADVQLVTASLLSRDIDVFFANPDNIVFASFETIVQSCNKKNIPIMTSEAGLVERGALAAYGADIYQWGFQAGLQAARFLKTKSTTGLHWDMVKTRKRVFNPQVAKKFGISIPPNFQPIQ
jgi:putative ABC transport system substrate-binding protein